MEIYIANLEQSTTENDLWDMFSNIGVVTQVEIIRTKRPVDREFAVIQLQAPVKKTVIKAPALMMHA